MSNFNFNFSVGARVYYPEVSNKVLTLKEYLSPEYPLETNWTDLSGDLDGDSFTENGRRSIFSLNPCIFPATQEWYDKLIHIYPNLEKPHTKKSPKQVIQAMLDDGKAGIVCYVSDKDPQPPRSINKELITVIDNNTEYMFCSYSNCFRYAVPFDLDTGKIIVDYVNGDVVLED